MKTICQTIICILLLVSAINVAAQSDSTEKIEKLQFRLGTYYNSNLNYYGRTDSLKSSGFFPVAEIWFNKNFYITAAPIFISNRTASFEYAGSVATAGFRAGKEHRYNSNIYIVKPLYKDNSQLVQSSLKVQAIGTYTWLSKILNITAGGDIKFSDQLDYGATAGADHIFRIGLPGKLVLVLDPSAYVNAGTQQFTKTSYKQNGYLFFPGVQQQVNESVQKFSILSYEFSMPVVLAVGKLQIFANPAYVMPQNLVKIENRPDISERGENLLYITVGAKMNF